MTTVLTKIIANISVNDVFSLDLSNNFLQTLAAEDLVLEQYPEVQLFTARSCEMTSIEQDVFPKMPKLTTVDLSNNSLTSLSSDLFSSNAILSALNLSYNLLDTLEEFNVTDIQNLKLLDLSNNNLTYLPSCFLQKLNENNDFQLSISENPWNCEDINWAEQLTLMNLYDIFCPILDEPVVVATTTDASDSSLPISDEDLSHRRNSNNASSEANADGNCKEPETTEQSSLHLLWLILPAFVLGIIVGNCKTFYQCIVNNCNTCNRSRRSNQENGYRDPKFSISNSRDVEEPPEEMNALNSK